MARRGRPKKPGRAEVATEHMVLMGFNHDDISRELDILLELYGENGWLFIESDAYKVLIDALLDAQEKGAQPENNGNGNLLVTEQALAEGFLFVLKSVQHFDSSVFPPYYRLVEMEPADTNLVLALPEATDPEPSHPHCKEAENIRRKPCYGWICYEHDEENDIIELSPIRDAFQRNSDSSYDEMEPKRKTRWDLAPNEV